MPTDAHKDRQAQTDPHSSPPFKQRICSLPQSLIVFRSGSEENNHSVIVTHSRKKDGRWKNRNLGHYALFRLYLQTGVVISRSKRIWGRVFPKAVSSNSWPCSSAASMGPSLPIRYVCITKVLNHILCWWIRNKNRKREYNSLLRLNFQIKKDYRPVLIA